MNHIVFISHDANRTGAPIVLLHLLRWLKEQQLFSFSIILLRGGELESEFRALGPTYVWYLPIVPDLSPPLRIWNRGWHRLLSLVRPPNAVYSKHEQMIIANLAKENTSLIYANTVVSAEVAVQLKAALNCPAVCHVHELSMAIEGYFGTARFGNLVPALDLVIAASEAVKKNLVSTYPLVKYKIEKVYEFINQSKDQHRQSSEFLDIRSSLGIPDNAYIIAASGTFEWRKSPSLFIQIADYMRRHTRIMPYFIWIGGSNESSAWQELQFDVERLELTEFVKFIGSRPNLLDYLQSASIFVLTSREDPYPLVCLEAAMMGKPILCFEQSGGMPEFVENDCGRIIPFLQVDLMAHAIQELLLDPIKLQELGSNAQAKVQSQHSVEVAGQQVVKLIKKVIQKSSIVKE